MYRCVFVSVTRRVSRLEKVMQNIAVAKVAVPLWVRGSDLYTHQRETESKKQSMYLKSMTHVVHTVRPPGKAGWSVTC